MRPRFCTSFLVVLDLLAVGSLPDTHSGMIRSAERGGGGGLLEQPSADQTATQHTHDALARLTTIPPRVVSNRRAAQALPARPGGESGVGGRGLVGGGSEGEGLRNGRRCESLVAFACEPDDGSVMLRERCHF